MDTKHPLRKYRKNAGITLEALGREVGVSKAWLSRIENGNTPSLALISRLARATDGAVSPYDFIEETANAESRTAEESTG